MGPHGASHFCGTPQFPAPFCSLPRSLFSRSGLPDLQQSSILAFGAREWTSLRDTCLFSCFCRRRAMQRIKRHACQQPLCGHPEAEPLRRFALPLRLLCCAAVAIAASPVFAQALYGVISSGTNQGYLVSINPTNGAATPIGDTGLTMPGGLPMIPSAGRCMQSTRSVVAKSTASIPRRAWRPPFPVRATYQYQVRSLIAARKVASTPIFPVPVRI